MKRRPSWSTGREPRIGGQHPDHYTGREPSLSHEFRPLYGPARITGLEAPPVSGRRRPLVVLAEYDDAAAELVLLIAESNGYEVRIADSGWDAWQLVQALEPNLLVTNLRLPGMSGIALIRRLREHCDRLIANVPILVMDAYYYPEDILEVFRAGADDYLEEPYDIRAMLVCWRRVTGSLRRPAPLTAVLNEKMMIRQVALACLLEMRPPGLASSFGELLWHPDPDVVAAVRWGLWQMGTPEAQSILAEHTAASPSGWDG